MNTSILNDPTPEVRSPRLAMNAAGTNVGGSHLLDPATDESLYPSVDLLPGDALPPNDLSLTEPQLPLTADETVVAEPVTLPVQPTLEEKISARALNRSQFVDGRLTGPEIDQMISPADDGGLAVPSPEAQGQLADTMLPGERAVHLATISNGIYWKSVAMILLAVITMFYTFTLAFYFLAVAAIMLLLAWSTQRALMVAATDKRIVVRAGILNLQTMEIPYSRIESVDIAMTPMGMLLGYSNLIITGMGGKRFVVPYVRDAIAFRDDFTQWMLAREDGYRA